jgi:uroporphyrinogen III methyltransferase/synthase
MTSVLVTRPVESSVALCRNLEEHGIRAVPVPTLATVGLDDATALDEAVRNISAYDWLVVTSATGARILGERLAVLGKAAVADGLPRLAAIGGRTGAALGGLGLPPAVVPARATAAAIVDAIRPPGSTIGRVLLLRADAASRDLPDALRAAGASVDDTVAYRTVEGPASSRAALVSAFRDPALAAIVFASGSAVRGLARLADDERLGARARGLPAVTIGPRTSASARAAGFDVAGEAAGRSVEALTEAVVRYLSRRAAFSDHLVSRSKGGRA